MKFNKKLVVPFFATVAGLSIAGGLGGAFAWYQFNSTVRTGFIGNSVAKGGMLQIGYKDTGNVMHWGSDRYLPETNLIPVTFGALNNDGTLKTNAYGYPEAGEQSGSDYTTGWTRVENGQGYYQYDIYLRALVADSGSTGVPSEGIEPGYKLAAKDVYFSAITLEDANNGADALITNALRVHYQVEGGNNGLISKNAIDSEHKLNLYGPLDLDGDGHNDKAHDVNYTQDPAAADLIYGINGETQTTKAAADMIQARDSAGMMPSTATDKLICTTKTTAPTYTKITITVWLEGWSLLQVTNTPTYSNIWNPNMNSGMQVHVGMTFDVGRNILE